MYNMNSIEYLFVQYVMCVVNEGDKDTVMSLTFEGAMDLISRAGVNVTEHPDMCVECDDDEGDEIY